MNALKNIKTIFLVIIVLFLLGSTIFLAVTIQNESNQTGAINTRASEDGLPTEESDELLAYRSTTPGTVSPTTIQTSPTKAVVTVIPTTMSNGMYGGVIPSPTKAANVTTVPNTMYGGGGTIITSVPTKVPSTPSPTMMETKGGITSYPTVTPVTQLLETGVGDTIMYMVGGGAMLILVAFLL